MQFLERAADRVAQGLALVGAVGIAAMLVHIGVDVLTRNLLGRPIPATNEVVAGYYMVLIAFLPLAWVERNRGMVSVDLLEAVMSPQARRVSDLFVALLATALYLVIAWVGWQAAMSRWNIGAFVDVLGYRLPIWPTYFLPPVGFLLAAMMTLLRAVQSAREAIRGTAGA
jgi:TRAP-type C4-dicarboxylate transport system permease small subunit